MQTDQTQAESQPQTAETTPTTTTGTTPNPTTTSEAKTVPLDRFETVARAKREAEARAEALAAEVERYKTEAGRVPELEEALTLTRSGLADDRGQAVARTLYGLIPEAERPASLAEWVASKPADLATWMGGTPSTGAEPAAQPKGSPAAGAGAALGDQPSAGKSRIDSLRDATNALMRAQAAGDTAQIERALTDLQRARAAALGRAG